MADYVLEAGVGGPILAAPDLVERSAHVVVDRPILPGRSEVRPQGCQPSSDGRSRKLEGRKFAPEEWLAEIECPRVPKAIAHASAC